MKWHTFGKIWTLYAMLIVLMVTGYQFYQLYDSFGDIEKEYEVVDENDPEYKKDLDLYDSIRSLLFLALILYFISDFFRYFENKKDHWVTMIRSKINVEA